MIKLVQNGLFGNNLYSVDSPPMVKRYNECLEDIGLQKTKLKKFHIDGWGWSPEIAEEQKNRFYLSHGLANPFGVIISPKQQNAPIYMPFHSFDREIHKYIFKTYSQQIEDITATCGLWFELDQEISAYRSPQDLLMVDYINVNFYSVDRIMTAAREQRALIREFHDVPQAWSNDELRLKIIESSQKYGDLRFRKFEIPKVPFSAVENYYTLGFNGLYILKGKGNEKPLLIFKDNSSKVSGQLDNSHIEFNIDDPGLLSYLYNKSLISNDIDLFTDHPSLIEIMKDFFLVKAAVEHNEKVEFKDLNTVQKKGLVNRMLQEELLSDVYFELERLLSALQKQEQLDRYITSETLQPYLLHPHPSLSTQESG